MLAVALLAKLYKSYAKCHAEPEAASARDGADLTTESEQTEWTVEGLLDLFDVQADGDDRFTGVTGIAGDDERQVVEGTQVLAQAIVAVANRFPDKSVRSAHAVFSRAVVVGPPIELVLDVVSEGRSTATAIVAVHQNGRRCLSITVLADVPTGVPFPAPEFNS